MVALAVVLGVTAFPVDAGADSSTTVPAIVITKVYDGTVPFDTSPGRGNDLDDHNGIVRAGDLVGYRFDYSLNDPSAATPTAYHNATVTTDPLTLGFLWDSIPPVCSGANSAISGDGISTPSVLICNMETHSTGDAWSMTANVRVLPTVTDGSFVTLRSTMRVDTVPTLTAATSVPVQATSLPKLDIQNCDTQ